MKYRAIIFDMDGTITDTEQIWKEANKRVLQEYGFEVTPEFQEKLFKAIQGAGVRHSCTILKEMANLEHDLETIMQKKSDLAHSLYEEGVRFIEGFVEFHNKAQEYGLKTGIATNADDNTVLLTNKALDLQQFFGNHIYSISRVGYTYKPDPAIYLHVAQQLKIDPEYCIAIEDSACGIQSAKQAGMYCVGINSAQKPEYLEGAHETINTYNEVNLETLLIRKKTA